MRISQLRRIGQGLAVMAAGLALAACSNLLDVQFPGRIPADQINSPSLAPVLARSVIGDLECAYNNYMSGSAAQSDEFESANGNVPGANWGERSINADEDDYVLGACENSSYFGMHGTLQTARFQAEDIFARLSGWTDAQVPGRQSLMATVKAYGGFPYLFMGETFCQVAFDGKAPSTLAEGGKPAHVLAETKFTEAIALAQTAGNTDILNLARVGLARAKLDLKKYAEAAAVAALIPAGYVKMADRGTESSRRWNKLFYFMSQNGYYVVAQAFRNSPDPRIVVVDAGRDAFNPGTRLYATTKYAALNSPEVLASGREARLIQAEGLAETGNVAGAMALVNTRRAEVGLGPVSAGTIAAAVTIILNERRAELAFEGGHRLNDLLRRGLPWKGAQGSTKTSNEFTGRLYGATTCWPLPTKEKNGA